MRPGRSSTISSGARRLTPSRSARGGRAAEDLWGDVVLKMISDDPEDPDCPMVAPAG